MVKQALLTEEQMGKYLKWARQHSNHTQEFWERVFWSDKCAIQKDSDAQVLWVFCRQDNHEKYSPKNIQGQEKGEKLFQMI